MRENVGGLEWLQGRVVVVVEVDRLDSLCFEVGRGGVDFRDFNCGRGGGGPALGNMSVRVIMLPFETNVKENNISRLLSEI